MQMRGSYLQRKPPSCCLTPKRCARMCHTWTINPLCLELDQQKSCCFGPRAFQGLPTCCELCSHLQEVCTMRSIPVPTILSESGRALASHHSVMVFDVLTRWDEFYGTVLKSSGRICLAHLKLIDSTSSGLLPPFSYKRTRHDPTCSYSRHPG